VTGHILVVEDEPAIARAIAYALEREGFTVESVDDGESGLDRALTGTYDVVILDLMLPKLSGAEICRRLRRESVIPILMLTARTSEIDRVTGLEIGADDYVTKPFSIAELVSRVRALLRRREFDLRSASEGIRRVGALELDPGRHRVLVDGRDVGLTPSEFRLLAFLASSPERVFSRREIMQHLWQSSYVGDERACEVHVSNIRRKIERDPTRPERLLTVRGAGYKLVAA
jgi:two-component system response regulator RegX3